ncbi:MAG: hypothetical protein ABJA37_08900 [Ferruginibacter sp.]
MKQTFKKIITGSFLFAFVFLFNSCKKDEGKLPNIAFKTGATYTSANATIAKNTPFTVGIIASLAESGDILKTFDASVAYDASANSTSFFNETLTGAQGNNYDKDLVLTTRSQSGSEKWTFTVTNRDGLVNSVSFVVTVP